MASHAHRNTYQKIRFAFDTAKKYLITALLPSLVLFATLTFTTAPVWADIMTFPAGSLIIPMDTDYQDSGMLKAYGLVDKLLRAGVPVIWCINPDKTVIDSAQGNFGADFAASATDFKTGAVITAHGYRGGPFVIDFPHAAAATPIITAWQANNQTTVHAASQAFDATARLVLTASPRIAVLAGSTEATIFSYLNAAGITDESNLPWASTSVDLLTQPQVAGFTSNPADGALFNSSGQPKFCTLALGHWNVTSPGIPNIVPEIQTFLQFPAHLFAECQAVAAVEGEPPSGGQGKLLTSAGFIRQAAPYAVQFSSMSHPFAQLDGAFGTVGGSHPAFELATGSTYYDSSSVMVRSTTASSVGLDDVWIGGYYTGTCSISDLGNCINPGPKGKVTYLGGHRYTTSLPISTNPTTQGARLFLNSILAGSCAHAEGQPVISITAAAPATTMSATITYILSYSNDGPGPGLGIHLTDTLPLNTSFVSATAGGTFSGGTVSWNLGDLASGASGSVSVTVNLSGLGTYSNQATASYAIGLTSKAATSNSVQTDFIKQTPPIADAGPDQTIEATGSAGAAVSLDGSGSTDPDGDALSYIWTGPSGSVSGMSITVDLPLGVHTVTLNVSDGLESATDTVMIAVRDTTPPMIVAHADATVEATSSTGAVVSYTSPSAADAVDGAGVANCSPASGSAFALGNTTVTCSATDAHGNAATPTTFVVLVVDATAPVVTVPANMTVEASGATGSIVTFTSSATDLVDGVLATTCTPASGSTFAIGTTAVTCSATDTHGNTGTASFTVTVIDTTPPVIAAHADVTAEATSAAGAIVTYINPVTADAVDGPGVASCLPASGSLFQLGNTTVTCSATDAHGNAAAATSFVVHVADTTAPTITAPANITAEATSAAGAVVNYSLAIATDAVSIPTVTCSPLSGSTFPLGTTTITCTATDAAGNSSSATFSVTVQDTTPPVISISQLPLANANGWNNTDVTISFSATDAVSTPTCTINLVTLTAEGSAQVVSTICTDAANNSATANRTVNIDKTAPVVTGTRTPAANADGWNNTDVTAHFTATDGLSGVEGSAAADVVVASEGMGQTASTSFTDLAGNTGSATVSNINIDKTAPVLTMPSLASSYGFNSSLSLTFAATDALSQIATQSATLNGNSVSSGSTVVLSQLGTNTFVLTATDKAGNSVTETRQFSVSYTFGGFLSPLAGNRTTFHLGSVIPVKFDLFDANGVAVSSAVAHLSLQQYSGDEPVGDPIDATPASGADSGNVFRYSGGHYMYNLSTKPFSAGIWRIQATLDDGTVRTIEIGLSSK